MPTSRHLGNGAPGPDVVGDEIVAEISDDAAGTHPGSAEQGARRDKHIRLAAMTAMTSTLAHDLIQPLAAALNFLRAASRQLRDVEGAGDARDLVERAAEQTGKAVEIIRRMRGFVVNGSVRARRESLRDMLAQVRRNLLVEGRLDAELLILVAADAEFVLGDRIQLEQVLTNLIVNAAEAVAGQHFRRIEVTGRRAGREIDLRVRDSGPGLSDEALGRLFEPLFTTKEGGTGLGLVICKAIVEAHGGRLWAENSGRGGAAFRMCLPAAEQAESGEEEDDDVGAS
jgi:C4-dicarboxylate-specific signal transduction histidine kinase